MLKLPAIVITRISLLFAALSLAACGGGSSGGGSSDNGTAPAPDPGTVATAVKPGIFNTIITYDSGAPDQRALTLISSSGEYAIYFIRVQDGMFGTLTFPGNDTFSDDNGTYVFLDGTWQSVNGSLDGDASSLEEFTAKFTPDIAVPDVGLGLTGTRSNEISDLRVTMQDLNENYSQFSVDPDTGAVTQTAAVTIGADGQVNGSEIVIGSADDEGCIFEGSVSIPNSAYNIFEGKLSLTNCASIPGGASSEQRNGDYKIVGFLQPSQQGTKELVFVGTNGEVRFVFIGAE